jgi:hypothetical protein
MAAELSLKAIVNSFHMMIRRCLQNVQPARLDPLLAQHIEYGRCCHCDSAHRLFCGFEIISFLCTAVLLHTCLITELQVHLYTCVPGTNILHQHPATGTNILQLYGNKYAD